MCGGEGDGEFLGHAAKDSFVDVLDAVCGAEDADPLRHALAVGGRKSVPVGHESNVALSIFYRSVEI